MARGSFQGLKPAKGLNENSPATQEASGGYCQPPQPPAQRLLAFPMHGLRKEWEVQLA